MLEIMTIVNECGSQHQFLRTTTSTKLDLLPPPYATTMLPFQQQFIICSRSQFSLVVPLHALLDVGLEILLRFHLLGSMHKLVLVLQMSNYYL
jgi:hypothetical protein